MNAESMNENDTQVKNTKVKAWPLWETLYPLEGCLGEVVQDGYPKGIARRLVCPVCGDLCVHVRTDDSHPGGSDYTLGVACFCEQGHAWEILFAFHEGETTVYLQAVEKPVSFTEFLQETTPRLQQDQAMQQNATSSSEDGLDRERGLP